MSSTERHDKTAKDKQSRTLLNLPPYHQRNSTEENERKSNRNRGKNKNTSSHKSHLPSYLRNVSFQDDTGFSDKNMGNNKIPFANKADDLPRYNRIHPSEDDNKSSFKNTDNVQSLDAKKGM